ncbi:hypothetical protein C8R45DRAFT_1221538 [Mycena sanguinolenta]|nr:hypothetical protein C8R45DRAFT_1221538 [Mycena sanguinolenta]
MCTTHRDLRSVGLWIRLAIALPLPRAAGVQSRSSSEELNGKLDKASVARGEQHEEGERAIKYWTHGLFYFPFSPLVFITPVVLLVTIPRRVRDRDSTLVLALVAVCVYVREAGERKEAVVFFVVYVLRVLRFPLITDGHTVVLFIKPSPAFFFVSAEGIDTPSPALLHHHPHEGGMRTAGAGGVWRGRGRVQGVAARAASRAVVGYDKWDGKAEAVDVQTQVEEDQRQKDKEQSAGG